MDLFEFRAELKKSLGREASKIAERNGKTLKDKHHEYTYQAGIVKGLESAITIVDTFFREDNKKKATEVKDETP